VPCIKQAAPQHGIRSQKAAEQGDATAQGSLASMYRTGQGAQQDFKQAAAWYRKSQARQIREKHQRIYSRR
jgi:TPR repeat protein